jgi:hypothetical protein
MAAPFHARLPPRKRGVARRGVQRSPRIGARGARPAPVTKGRHVAERIRRRSPPHTLGGGDHAMPRRRSHGLLLVVIIVGALLLVPAVLTWSADDGALEGWAGGMLLRLGLGDGSRFVIHDERGELDVHVVDGLVARVTLDGRVVPAERLRREDDELTVLREDGSEWGQLSLAIALEDESGGRHPENGALAGVSAEMLQLAGRLDDDVAAHMGAALRALEPPLSAPVLEQLDEAVQRAASDCVGDVDRTVTTGDPDAAGITLCTVELDPDDLVQEFADALEDAFRAAGTPLAWADVTRVRQALSRAAARLGTLEYRLGP